MVSIEKFSKILDIDNHDIDRMDYQLGKLLEKSYVEFRDFFNDAMKIPTNEEELKFICFRLGQMEMFSFLISLLSRAGIDEELITELILTGIRRMGLVAEK